MKLKAIAIILCALFIQGCNNYMAPAAYNKAEELCTKYNEKVEMVINDPLHESTSPYKLTIKCSNNLTIRSSIAGKQYAN